MTATSILFLVFFCLFFLLTSPAFVFTQSPENNSLRDLAAGPQGGANPPPKNNVMMLAHGTKYSSTTTYFGK